MFGAYQDSDFFAKQCTHKYLSCKCLGSSGNRWSIKESLSDDRLSEADAAIIANSCSDNALRRKAVGFGEKCPKHTGLREPKPRSTDRGMAQLAVR